MSFLQKIAKSRKLEKLQLLDVAPCIDDLTSVYKIELGWQTLLIKFIHTNEHFNIFFKLETSSLVDNQTTITDKLLLTTDSYLSDKFSIVQDKNYWVDIDYQEPVKTDLPNNARFWQGIGQYYFKMNCNIDYPDNVAHFEIQLEDKYGNTIDRVIADIHQDLYDCLHVMHGPKMVFDSDRD